MSELSTVSALRVLCNGECLFICNYGVSIDLILAFFTKPDLSTEGSGSPAITVDNNSLTSTNTTNMGNSACMPAFRILYIYGQSISLKKISLGIVSQSPTVQG